jgi:hypothetical protein
LRWSKLTVLESVPSQPQWGERYETIHSNTFRVAKG